MKRRSIYWPADTKRRRDDSGFFRPIDARLVLAFLIAVAGMVGKYIDMVHDNNLRAQLPHCIERTPK